MGRAEPIPGAREWREHVRARSRALEARDAAIRSARRDGIAVSEIARQFAISPPRVYAVLEGRSRPRSGVGVDQ